MKGKGSAGDRGARTRKREKIQKSLAEKQETRWEHVLYAARQVGTKETRGLKARLFKGSQGGGKKGKRGDPTEVRGGG